ncbi:MAG TPA: Rne/Rng family ribonuclease [Stellaceae bacterium]|nr:Rne/Rng family ribonuclease [Stellaceae bacterium]
MAKRMLIDAAHPEEIRVALLNGNRLEDYDFEAAIKRQIKGNIYLAKVTRVEPSLQAAFVEYGGNRHGFLAFNEIHPDYYRIPVSDRADFTYEPRRHGDAEAAGDDSEESAGTETGRAIDHGEDVETDAEPESGAEGLEQQRFEASERSVAQAAQASDNVIYDTLTPDSAEREVAMVATAPFSEPEPRDADSAASASVAARSADDTAAVHDGDGPMLDIAGSGDRGNVGLAETPEELAPAAEPPETIGGGDEMEEAEAEAPRPRFRSHRHYKIQEVIKRRQIMLVQVTKEERGNKGAALTTYLSLAGRYCVLMPNTPRGGGVSRKITSIQDRRRLKDLMSDLSVPEGMGVIVRTAGSERSKPEIKRDFEYLMRLWEEIRDLTLKSTAPALVYEEGNLIKRSIRDLYSRDIEEVVIDGDDSYRAAKNFMKMLMPSHAKRVKPYRDPTVPLFHRFQVEGQIDAIHSPVVQLRSGGYIVINPTEALVAIDVNSGRATRERNIEETALKTNLEAAEEVARQLRLRDLAGLIVIDFIDMEESRNAYQVERRVKDAMRHDRARIQIGRISAFGLLELSRQRLRPSLIEASTEPCPHCGGTGHIRSTESTALHILRAIEEEGMQRRSAEISVVVPTNVSLYLLNHKRDALTQNEKRYGFHILIGRDDTLVPPAFRLDRLRALTPEEIAALPTPAVAPLPIEEEEDDTVAEDEADSETEEAAADTALPPPAGMPILFDREEREAETEAAPPARDAEREGERGGRRRGRHRRRGEKSFAPHPPREAPHPAPEDEAAEGAAIAAAPAAEGEPQAHPHAPHPDGDSQGGEHKRRRRGRRGGRRRRRDGGAPEGAAAAAEAEGPESEMVESLGESFGESHDTDVGADIPATEPLPMAPPESEPEPIESSHHSPEPEREPAPASAAERPPAPQSEPAPAPRRGWWRRR